MPNVDTKKNKMAGGVVYFETVIYQGSTRVKATGKTAEESRRKAEDKWSQKQLGGR